MSKRTILSRKSTRISKIDVFRSENGWKWLKMTDFSQKWLFLSPNYLKTAFARLTTSIFEILVLFLLRSILLHGLYQKIARNYNSQRTKSCFSPFCLVSKMGSTSLVSCMVRELWWVLCQHFGKIRGSTELTQMGQNGTKIESQCNKIRYYVFLNIQQLLLNYCQ